MKKQFKSRNLNLFNSSEITRAENLNIKGGKQRATIIIKDIIVLSILND